MVLVLMCIGVGALEGLGPREDDRQNLLRNAVQASAERATIELQGELNGSAYLIRVLDRGEGIPPAIKTRLFEPFESGRPNGTGLGLAVCEGIVRAHGGSIEARDRSGGGTEFVIRVPTGAAPRPEPSHV
jgi:signal transduction histidine kinase